MEKIEKKMPLVVIFGRTNVGKSTLFNRLTDNKRALVSDIPGTTRDSNSGLVNWQGSAFELVDTGGIIEPSEEVLFKKRKGKKEFKTVDEINVQVQKQAVEYLKKADLVLFVVDNKTGLLPQDRQMVTVLRKHLTGEIEKKILLVANKADSGEQRFESAVFNKLGLGEPLAVSAATGAGTGDLLETIIKFLKKKKLARKTSDKEKERISVCILGKPNVGKSSLLNALLGYEKVIVSPVPHTTREPQDTEIIYKGKNIVLVDTAGISKHGHKTDGLEKSGMEKSLGALRRANIALLVVDIKEGLTHQDVKLASDIIEAGKSLIIIANKWDLIEKRDTKEYTAEIRGRLPFAMWAPIQFLSAKTKWKVQKVFDLVLEMDEARKTSASDSQLQHFLSSMVRIHLPAKAKGTSAPHIYEIKQVSSNPPRFTVRIGSYDTLHFSYIRFIQNQLRERFKLIGMPISIDIINNPVVHGLRQAGAPNRKKRPIAGRPAPAPKGYKGGRR